MADLVHFCESLDFADFVFGSLHTKENCQALRKRVGEKNMVSDAISDFIIRIKNGYLARHKTVSAPYGKRLLELGKILAREKFIEEVKQEKQDGKQQLLVTLSYPKRKPALLGILRVSKPGLRVYVRRSRIPRVLGGLGAVILSTPQGLMTGKEAIKKNLGGEVVCKVW